jgi:hypothetical protein
MPDPTLPLPTEPIPPPGQHPVPPAVDPYEDATFAAYEPPQPRPEPGPPALPPAPVPPPPVPQAALPVPTPAPPSPIIARIADISVSSTIVYTPTGEMPLKRSQWIVTEQWQAHTRVPTWAILMCVFTFFCFPFLNFLFLLAKQTYYTGHATVSVASAGRHYVTRVAVKNQTEVAQLQSQVNYVRSLAAL